MPRVSRLTGTHTTNEGVAVETDANGDTYRYEFRADDEGEQYRLTERTRNGEDVELKTTEAVRDVLEDRGVDLADQ